MFVRDLNGNEYPLQATTTHDFELNGNQLLSFTITPSKVNDAFIENFSEMWEVVDDQDVAHKVIYARKRGEGKRLTVDVKATPLFFDALDMDRIYEKRDEHMTAATAFNYIFDETDFDFVLTGSFAAVQWEGFGDGQTRLATFKRALDRYKAEFKINGNVVTLANQIGRDTSFMYRHQLNASNIVQEIDATQLWTYAKGFGNFAEGQEQNALLIREYTSPLATVVGLRHAPPIYNGAITTAATMDTELRTLVDNSLQISVSTDVHDLRKQGYPLAQPELGDRVFLMDERIGLDEEVRINSITVVKDWMGNVLDLKLVIGSESLVKRHQSGLTAAVDRITDLLAGREKLPYNVLPNAIRLATEALNSAMTELVFQNGITGIDPDDPNLLTRFTSRGLGVSNDGGFTFPEAITGNGINTSLLTAGDIHTNNVRIIGENNYFYWDGNALMAIDPNNVGKYVRLNSDGAYLAKGAVTIERPDGYKVIDNGMLQYDFALQGGNPAYTDEPEVERVEKYYRTASTVPRNIDYYVFRHDARYVKLVVGLNTDTVGKTARFYAYSTGGGPEGGNVIGSFITTETDPSVNQVTITLDFGTPTGNQIGFYARISTGAFDAMAYARIIAAYKEG